MSTIRPPMFVLQALTAITLLGCETEDEGCPRWSFRGDTAIPTENRVQFAVTMCRDVQNCSVGTLDTASSRVIELQGDPVASFELLAAPETNTWHYVALVESDNPSARLTIVDESTQTRLLHALMVGSVESCPALTIDVGPRVTAP